MVESAGQLNPLDSDYWRLFSMQLKALSKESGMPYDDAIINKQTRKYYDFIGPHEDLLMSGQRAAMEILKDSEK